ncbi:Omp28-related outer membrane protein [Wenyingzhuangia sp. IMCC45533]
MNFKKLTQIVTFLFVTAIVSCSKKEEDMKEDNNVATSIKVLSDSNVYSLQETIVFLVETNLGNNVTAESVLTINDVVIDGNTYVPQKNGSYSVKASYNNLSTSSTFTVGNVSNVELITDAKSIEVGSTVQFITTAVLANGSKVDVSENTQFFVNENLIFGNKYIPNQAEKAMKVKAVFNDVASNEVSIDVNELINIPASFTQKVVVEDYTGTWCGWCPRVSQAIDLVKAQSSKVFVVKIHDNDIMENDYSIALKAANQVESHPTAFINRQNKWTGSQPDNLDKVLSKAIGTTQLGLAVNSILFNQQMTISVAAGFAEDTTGLKLVVFVLEDKIIASQLNYTSFYHGENPVLNFEHNNVIIYAATNVLGDDITATRGIKHKQFTVDLSDKIISNASNTAILAMLVDENNNQVMNAQYAKVNAHKVFD